MSCGIFEKLRWRDDGLCCIAYVQIASPQVFIAEYNRWGAELTAEFLEADELASSWDDIPHIFHPLHVAPCHSVMVSISNRWIALLNDSKGGGEFSLHVMTDRLNTVGAEFMCTDATLAETHNVPQT